MNKSTQPEKTANMESVAGFEIGDSSVELPVIAGSEDERAIDITHLRDQTGLITLDEGYRNTGSAKSAITFINGEDGVLRYRGIPIEQLAEKSTFVETALLLIYGELPTADRFEHFRGLFSRTRVNP